MIILDILIYYIRNDDEFPADAVQLRHRRMANRFTIRECRYLINILDILYRILNILFKSLIEKSDIIYKI